MYSRNPLSYLGLLSYNEGYKNSGLQVIEAISSKKKKTHSCLISKTKQFPKTIKSSNKIVALLDVWKNEIVSVQKPLTINLRKQ